MSTQGAVSALGSVSFSWLHELGGLVFDERFFLDPAGRLETERAARELVASKFPADPIYCIEAHLVQLEGRRRPVALVGGLQPNLILGAALGARLLFPGDRDPDIDGAPLAETTSLQRLQNIDWTGTWPVSLFLEQLNATRKVLGGSHATVPPFFWDTTGRATLHGILTTAQKLRGTRIYEDMTDRPAFVHDLLHWISEAYVELARLFARAASFEITGVHIGECSACMLGAEKFAEFVLPPTRHLLRELGPGCFHSCGTSNHLLAAFEELDGIEALNVGSGTNVAAIRERFGGRRVDLIPDAKLLTFGTAAEVDRWLREVIEENAGGELEFQFHLERDQPEENCLQIARTLRSLGYTVSREEVF